MPVAAVGVGDEAELVDGCDEGAEEEEVDEGDENGGAFGGCVADQCVDGPEDGDDADYEEDEDVDRGDLVCLDVAVDEVGLFFFLLLVLFIGVCRAI